MGRGVWCRGEGGLSDEGEGRESGGGGGCVGGGEGGVANLVLALNCMMSSAKLFCLLVCLFFFYEHSEAIYSPPSLNPCQLVSQEEYLRSQECLLS